MLGSNIENGSGPCVLRQILGEMTLSLGVKQSNLLAQARARQRGVKARSKAVVRAERPCTLIPWCALIHERAGTRPQASKCPRQSVPRAVCDALSRRLNSSWACDRPCHAEDGLDRTRGKRLKPRPSPAPLIVPTVSAASFAITAHVGGRAKAPCLPAAIIDSPFQSVSSEPWSQRTKTKGPPPRVWPLCDHQAFSARLDFWAAIPSRALMRPQDSVVIPVSGMHCAGCASRLERAAQAVPGVAAARANFALHQVALELETAEALGQALAAVEKAGFRPANPPVVTLTIEGITCASCVTRIESLLAKVPGVVAASVNPALGQAQVRGWADPAALLAAVRKGGYTARVLDATARLAAVPSETTAKTAQKAALIAAAFTLPLVVLEMGGHLSPALHAFLHHSVGTLGLAFLQWALASVVLAWPGAGFARVGWPALFRGAPDMNSLVALGTGAAWAWSSAVTLSMAFGHPLSDALYFEPAAVIITLVLVGRWLEARAKGQALASIHGLLELAPKHARRQTASGGWEEVSVDVIALGDILAVPPGTRVPVDGVVIEGEGAVDESLLTGEPIPVVKEKGAPVHAGTLNTEGALIMRATAVGAETMLQQIARLAAQAQAAKLPIQALVDRVARWFVPDRRCCLELGGVAVGRGAN